jgi:hypothetical protein
VVLTYYLCSYGESCLLVSWCAGGRCDMAGSDEDCGRNMRLDAEDQGWSSTGWVLQVLTDFFVELHVDLELTEKD